MTVRKRGVLGIPAPIDPSTFGQAAAGNAAAQQQQDQQRAGALAGTLGTGTPFDPATAISNTTPLTPQQKNPQGWTFGTPSATQGTVNTVAPNGVPLPNTTGGTPSAQETNRNPSTAQGWNTGQQMATPQAATGTPTGGYTLLPEWSYGGDQRGGATYVAGQGWINPTTLAAGTDIGINSGTVTGVKLPVAYNGAADIARWDLNGRQGNETSWSKVVRYTNDAIRNGQDPIAAMNNAIAIVNRDAAARGQTSGFEAAAATGAGQGQQQGGAPPTGAAPPTGGQQGGTTNTGGPPPANAQPGDVNPNNPNEKVVVNPVTGQKSYSALQDIALAGSDPDQVNTRRAMLMQSLGLDPTAQGLFYESVNKSLGDAMDRYLALQGIAPGTQYGTITQNMRNFENMVTSGDYYGQLHNNALATRQAFINGGNRGLSTGQQLSVLDQILGQQAEGMNPVLAQAMAQRSQQARTQIGIDTANQLGQGKGEITDPVQWLRNSRWADLLG